MSLHVESFKYAITVTLLFFERGMCLQRLGKVLHVTPSQNVVVKADKTPKIGSAVVDENLKVVGKVFDVIGPVPSPYVVVKPAIKEPGKLSDMQLYLLLSKKQRSKSRPAAVCTGFWTICLLTEFYKPFLRANMFIEMKWGTFFLLHMKTTS